MRKVSLTTLVDHGLVWAVLRNAIGLKIEIFDYNWSSGSNDFLKVNNEIISREAYQILEELSKDFTVNVKYFMEPYPIFKLKKSIPENIKLRRFENGYRLAVFFLRLFCAFNIEVFPEKNTKNEEFIKLLKKNNPPLYEKCKYLFHLENQ